MPTSLPLSERISQMMQRPRAERNAILKENGYRWEKFDQDWLDDNDDFERTPGWYLFSSDNREVTEHEAFEEIDLGLEQAQRLRDAEEHRRSETAWVKKLFTSWHKAAVAYVREYGENLGETYPDMPETLYDGRQYHIGAVLRTDGTNLYYVDYHGSDMAGPITYRLSPAPADEEAELAKYGNSTAQIIEALRGMQNGVAMPTLVQKGLGIQQLIELPPIADQPALPPEQPEWITAFFRDQVAKLPFALVSPEPCRSPRGSVAWLCPENTKAWNYDHMRGIGFDDQYVYLVANGPYSHDDRHHIAERHWPWSTWPHLFMRAALTPEAQVWIDANVPTWYDRSTHMALLELFKIPYEERKGQESDPGPSGRYKSSEFIARCLRDALLMGSNGIPLTSMTYTDAQLIYSNGQSRFTGKPFSIWTDGPQTTETYPPSTKHGEPLHKDAEYLVTTAGRRKAWRENDQWRSFLNVTIADRTKVKEEEKGGTSNGMSKSLFRFTLSDGRFVWLVEECGWSMGEDGDAWDDRSLHATEAEAKAAYNEIKLY